MPALFNILASFTTPQDITVTPYTLLWALPLLLGICIVVKAIKPQHFDLAELIKDSLRLFAGSAVVLILICLMLGLLVHFVNL